MKVEKDYEEILKLFNKHNDINIISKMDSFLNSIFRLNAI